VYRWVDHTAELELAIEAGEERQVFADALAALAELLEVSGSPHEPPEQREVTVVGTDRATQLAGWVEELLFLAEVDGFVAAALETIELDERSLRATVSGVIGAPRPLVKAATYHRLEFRRAGAEYVARVVLDV
jgi:SHS2 domain-containing protein